MGTINAILDVQGRESPKPEETEMDAREYFRDPAMRVAMESMRRSDAGVPSHDTVDRIHARRTMQRVSGSPQTGVRISRQASSALAGRPVQPLPTRTARSIKRRQRRMIRRIGTAAIFAFLALALTVLFIPVAAALGVATAVGTGALAYSK